MTEEDLSRRRIQGPYKVKALPSIAHSDVNEHGQNTGHVIHPDSFTAEQFKNIWDCFPDNMTCKYPGCFNLYGNPDADCEITVQNNLCLYHELFDWSDIDCTTPPPPDNTAIQQYNQQISRKLQDFQNRIFTLCEEIDKLLAFFMSIEAEENPGVSNPVKLIFTPQLLPTLKEELTGEAYDTTRKANNQTIETQNSQRIQAWENSFARKKDSFVELKKMWDKISNPDIPDKLPNKPNELKKPSNQPAQTPLKLNNSVIENNQKSEKNIKNISQTANLIQARQKAQQEVKELLDRYGTTTSESNSVLWDRGENWEDRLNSCISVGQVVDLIKKIKTAILQLNQQNNQAKQNLPLDQLQFQSINEIEELLQKYQMKGENLMKNKNWKKETKSLTSKHKVLELTRQLRENIIQQSKQQEQQNNFSANNYFSSFSTRAMILLSSGITLLAASIFLFRYIKNLAKKH